MNLKDCSYEAIRQGPDHADGPIMSYGPLHVGGPIGAVMVLKKLNQSIKRLYLWGKVNTVSYTHLTLPTILLV